MPPPLQTSAPMPPPPQCTPTLLTLSHHLSSTLLPAFRPFTNSTLAPLAYLQVRLLPRGRSLLRPDRAVEGPMCGLVPMRGPARASSAGGLLCSGAAPARRVLRQRPRYCAVERYLRGYLGTWSGARGVCCVVKRYLCDCVLQLDACAAPDTGIYSMCTGHVFSADELLCMCGWEPMRLPRVCSLCGRAHSHAGRRHDKACRGCGHLQLKLSPTPTGSF